MSTDFGSYKNRLALIHEKVDGITGDIRQAEGIISQCFLEFSLTITEGEHSILILWSKEGKERKFSLKATFFHPRTGLELTQLVRDTPLEIRCIVHKHIADILEAACKKMGA